MHPHGALCKTLIVFKVYSYGITYLAGHWPSTLTRLRQLAWKAYSILRLFWATVQSIKENVLQYFKRRLTYDVVISLQVKTPSISTPL